jgi:hypothetical protein
VVAANVSCAKRLPTGCAFRGQRVRSFATLKGSAANVMDIRSFAALKKIGRLQKFGARN